MHLDLQFNLLILNMNGGGFSSRSCVGDNPPTLCVDGT